ncbi:MAG: DUF6067 family protein [Phycisphaeraceae bacterium]|nr:DUF6067 family protein [Phycisphaeraceae bacterium]
MLKIPFAGHARLARSCLCPNAIAPALLCLCASMAVALPVPIASPGAERARDDDPNQVAGVDVWMSEGVDAELRRDVTQRRSGEASYCINHKGASHTGPSRSAVYIITGPAVDNLNYTATAWVKTRDAVEAGLRVRLKAAEGNWIDVEPTFDTLEGTNDWTKVNCRWRSYAGAARFILFLRVGVKGKAWFDDIQVHDDFESAAHASAFTSLHQDLAATLATARRWDHPFGAELARDAAARLAALDGQVAQYTAQLRSLNPGNDAPVELRVRRAQLTQTIRSALTGSRRLAGLGRAIDQSGHKDADYVAGWASSAVHVFLRDCPVDWRTGAPGRILAVKGEVEATQLVLFPIKRDLDEVNVRVSSLASPAGHVLGETQISVSPVGFVKTTIVPLNRAVPLEHEYLGWWPDPLLENFAFDVAAGDTQPVWIAVTVPRDQPAGIYTGHVRIEPANATPQVVPLEVEIADVLLPDSNPWAFRNLISFHPHFARTFYGDRWTPAMQEKFFEFLLDRRVNVVSMYQNEAYETVENMKRFAARGQNTFLIHWYTQTAIVSETDAPGMRARLEAFYPVMKSMNLLDRAYVYGWDEIGDPGKMHGMYGELAHAANILKREYPGVPVLTAGTDDTYGTDSPLTNLPIAFCPNMKFDVGHARQAQAAGNQVWWYDVNWTIDQHLVRSRLIAWQTFKLGADGYLMWAINRWHKNDKPIGKKILTDWNPTLDGVCPNSSAMYVYPGKDGPITSLRLENFRDGIEDYELLVEARRRGILIDITDDLTRDLTQYTTDPAVLEEHRTRLIRALAGRSTQR